ncbi:MAG: carboxypeptidase-like regulatory domain-containing protein [Pirellulaceae bacterium]|nr:carboxypeptidase-like regulatory domain-containing protein [Pirellulaceae bacterium]
MLWNRISCLVIIGLSLCVQPGCGGPSDQPELGQVTGTVTLDGQPLVGVAVVFQPDNGRPARGMTDAQGKYELIYIRQTKGTKVGPNRVEIAPSEEGEAEESETPDEEAKSATKPSKSGKPKVPARYNVQSELKEDVKPGANTIDFKLVS